MFALNTPQVCAGTLVTTLTSAQAGTYASIAPSIDKPDQPGISGQVTGMENPRCWLDNKEITANLSTVIGSGGRVRGRSGSASRL